MQQVLQQMENIKIINLLKGAENKIQFVEYKEISTNKTKILSTDNFIARFGIDKQELNKCKI